MHLLALVIMAALIQLSEANSRGQVLGWWWTNKQVLNTPQLSATTVTTASSSSEIVRDLKRTMLQLKGEFMSENGDKVDYNKMKSATSSSYQDFLKIASRLRDVDLFSIPSSQAQGFYINLYNCLCLHGLVEGCLSGSPSSSLNRVKFYAKASYEFQNGIVLSLNEIENGILRGNKINAAPFTRVPFYDECDSRVRLSLPCDARIHFALNCGAKSCPPIAVYSEDQAERDRQLDIATQAFLEGVFVNPERKTLHLSLLFKWYSSDFGSTAQEVTNWIIEHASPSKAQEIRAFIATNADYKVVWEAYDFALND